MSKTLLIIDGHNLLYKSYSVPFKFYSLNKTPLHVVTTFLSLLRRSTNLINPSHIVVVFDSQGKTKREKISSSYKINRTKDYSKEVDSPLHHLNYIKIVLDFLKIKFIERLSIEADDVIASIVTQFNNLKNSQSFIFSSDSDFYQLIDNSTKVIVSKRKELLIRDTEFIHNLFGIYPKDYVIFKSLIGDKADNIVGIRNIGHKKAANIINNKLEFNYQEYKTLLTFNTKLITLNTKLKLKVNFMEFKFKPKLLKFKNQEIWEKTNI